jgi:hypothetical protein
MLATERRVPYGRPMRLTYSNVMATIAVFVALGGTGVAAVSLRKNSVGSAQIRKGAVKASELGSNAVVSSKVKNGSLRAADFALGQLPSGPKGDMGATGPVGPTYGGISGATPPALGGGGSAVSTVGATIQLPASGDLLIFAKSEPADGSCTGNPCTIHMGIYLDGQPVPGSGLQYGPGVDKSVPNPTPDLFGRMAGVAPGEHEIQVFFVNTSGAVSSGGPSHAGSIAWVLLGGQH